MTKQTHDPNRNQPTGRSLYDPQFEHDACGVGFTASVTGRPSQRIVQLALRALGRLAHRGAADADAATGDGAGVLCQLPVSFFRREMAGRDDEGPGAGPLVVGMIFLPSPTIPLVRSSEIIRDVLKRRGFQIIGWRSVPVRDAFIGKKAAETRPEIRQVVALPPAGLFGDALERQLFVARKEMEARLTEAQLTCYICSLSHRTIVYKGLLSATELPKFYPDLSDPHFEAAFAIFHQRYSTNTFPNWFLAQPFRLLAHNGEINTLQGNRNWMRSREADLEVVWGEEAQHLKPIIWAEGSDSASLDNAVELLTRSGRDLVHSMAMVVPEAHEHVPHVDPDLRAFYEFHEAIMEPWDGPAALAFSDGVVVGATLDRNGLRPLRYVISDDGIVVVASEVGVADFEPEQIVEKGRLGPGQMLAVDFNAKRLLRNDEIKQTLAARQSYRAWLEHNLVQSPASCYSAAPEGALAEERLLRLERTFGYSEEDVKYILSPMARDGQQPTGSMGDDTPLAPFATKPRLLYSYFKQRFAQVTNPPIDPLREKLVMALEMLTGPWGNFLQESPDHARLIELKSPILTENQFAWLTNQPYFATRTLDATFAVKRGAAGLDPAIEALCQRAEDSVRRGATLLIVSDRNVGRTRAAIPMLLAISAVHHHLIRRHLRLRASLIAESAEPRQSHDFACLIGYGASAVFPYLAYEAVRHMVRQSNGTAVEEAVKKYVRTLESELLKIMSKMGISTLNSYCGAQIFEAVSLDRSVIDVYFTHTPSRVDGARLEDLAAEVLLRHGEAFGHEKPKLEDHGYYRYRRAGEYHAFNPGVVQALHKAARTGRQQDFHEYFRLVRERPAVALRDLLDFDPGSPIPLEEVEPVQDIVKRFCAPGMSHGALSREAHETVAIGLNRLGARSNSGEGGEDPRRYHPQPNGDSANSTIKQVASARFGVTPAYLVSAKELEIKMAQGSKPGEGGQLPGHKVSWEIAEIRHASPGITLISPPPHHDIYSIEDLAQLIYDLRRVNPEARIAVKLVAEAGVGTIAAGVAKAHADVVHISGHAGGTGASPLGSIKHAGVPWELGLSEAHQVLTLNGLRDRVRLRTDGGLQSGRDVIIAALLGADEFAFGTATLVAIGCVMARQCHVNTCPVGIATQREDLRARFAGTPEMAVRFFLALAEEVREWLAQLGFRRLDEIVGRTDLLHQVSELPTNVRGTFDLSPLLFFAGNPRPENAHQPKPSVGELDDRLCQEARPALEAGTPVRLEYAIQNTDRTVGARLAGQIARRCGDQGLPEGTIAARFIGTAGQSFGAFCIRGLRLMLEGDANDYVGKSMAGGQIIIYPPAKVPFARQEHTIIGNTVLYGATGGELFAAGAAGERFAVRNSGAVAVVEGVGDHGCEYMTGGTVVVLGPVGKNFAAGMTGGVAYVLDEAERLTENCNREVAQINTLTPDEEEPLRQLIERHLAFTQSRRAGAILQTWEQMVPFFRKVAAPVQTTSEPKPLDASPEKALVGSVRA
jgi:glutamate synthase domain-containing protein 2/glutamate synthase domain-containing protein 1/glutamate synthase domain-containing protein 3